MTLSLVTGGSGFVGRHLTEKLLLRGENVRVLDLVHSEAAETIVGSVDDSEIARRACEGVDTVFHLAGNAQLWARDEAIFDRINRGGTETMLAAAESCGVRRFIHCSSLTTLVGRSTPIGPSKADESVCFSPDEMLGAYPRSKRLAELAVERSVLDWVIAAPTEPLGPGDESFTPPTRLIIDLLRGRTPATINCTFNFVDVKSLAEGLIAARDKGARGERYLLAGENVTMRRLLETLEAKTGRRMPRAQLPYSIALLAGIIDTQLIARLTGKAPRAPLTGVRLAGRRVEFSSAKAKADLGWESAPFEDALQSALDWLSKKGAV